MSSPYSGLPSDRFWKTGVSNQSPTGMVGLYKKRFDISRETRVATAGSCFAQHIARHLKRTGVRVVDVEPPPPGLTAEQAQKFGYNLYSARYGNVYLVRQMLQIVQEALGASVPDDLIVWKKGERYFDAMRPSVEPNGLSSPQDVRSHRENHLRCVRDLIRSADLFVFTLGLTEGWIHKETAYAYPTAPGTIAGTFDPAVFAFKNFAFSEILEDFKALRNLMRDLNPGIRFLVTVSPVPLTATASESHVLVATTYSKSVLRAVAGELYSTFDDVDYFPSYEIIASAPMRGMFYEANLREVADIGVQTVMRTFFAEHHNLTAVSDDTSIASIKQEGSDEELAVLCDEVLLESFSR